MPPKRKSTATKAKEAAKRRALESSEQRSERLSQAREAFSIRLQLETPEERGQRLSQAREAFSIRLQLETPEERGQRLSRLRQASSSQREQESSSQRFQRQLRDRLSHASFRKSQERAHHLGRNLEVDPNIFYTEFEEFQMSIDWESCNQCNESFVLLKTVNGVCNRCRKFKDQLNSFSLLNNMDPGELPPELKDLSMVEEQLIARDHPVISVYRIKGQQYGYSGQVINFPQEVNDIAKKLPHSFESLSRILIVRKEQADNYKDFRVNRVRVHRALQYLKENNCFYQDIEINIETLNEIPENGNLFGSGNTLIHQPDLTGQPEINFDGEVSEGVITSCAPNAITTTEKRDQIQSILSNSAATIPWPRISAYPINEFTTAGYIAMAFPTLYPTGAADLRSPRLINVKPTDYFQHMMKYQDGRFAKNPRFRFFVLNSLSRWSSLQSGTICIQRNSELNHLSAEELKQKLKNEPALFNKLMCFNSSVRGTSAYWRARCGELLDMVNQLGAPTIFFTLSAADIHWPDLYRLLDPDMDNTTLDKAAAFKRRSKILNENPLVVSWFFQQRADFFIKKVIIPKFQVRDFWYRTEFQHRGSPHIHGVLWLENAPDISKLDNADETYLQNIVEYFNNIVSTVNPQINAPISTSHPSQIRYSEVNNHEEDFANLLNCCQRHTRHGPQCIRKNKSTGHEECRFKFPFPLVDSTHLSKNNGTWELITKRNDPLINKHNRFITEHWRANTDIQCILSVNAVLNYIAKYASKSEPSSKAMETLLSETVSKNDDSAKTTIQKIFIRMCSERDYSAQETFHLVMSWPLYHCSRGFVKVNVDSQQWIPLKGNEEHVSTSVLESYPQRPENLEDMPLFEMFSKYYKKGQQWVQRRTPAVVRIFPKYKPSGGNADAFYRQQVLLHNSWRNINEFEHESWEELYKNRVEQQVEFEIPPIEDEYEDEPDNDERVIDEWMVVAGTGPNNEFGHNVEIGSREIDSSFNWNSSYSNYSEPLSLPSFVMDRKLDSADEEQVHWEFPEVQLSEEQQSIVNILKRQIDSVKNEYSFNGPKMVIIQGKAGSGKSTVIKTLCATLNSELGSQSFKLMAPTGAAAVNVSGSTIHSALSISIGKLHIELGAEHLQKLQEDLRGCHFIIIDEMSMLGCTLFKKIDLRCREAKPNKCDQPFGGMFLYLLGDIKQLPPVLDRPFYGTGFNSSLSDQGQILYKNISQCFILNKSYRQNGSEQEVFRNLLDRLSVGESTEEDWRLLMEREKSIVSVHELEQFDESVHLYPENKSVSFFNLQKLESMNCPTAKVSSDNNNAEAAKADYETAQGLEKVLYLCVGSRVMLKTNLWVKMGLVNGALGTVTDIVYEPGKCPPTDQPLVICIKFDNYFGPLMNGSVPIAPVTRYWRSGNLACSRTQFPIILAWAVTIHKSQGLTLPTVVVSIGERELAPGCTYVALSRVKALNDILIYQGFNFDRLTRIGQMKLLGLRVEEEQRLKCLEGEID